VKIAGLVVTAVLVIVSTFQARSVRRAWHGKISGVKRRILADALLLCFLTLAMIGAVIAVFMPGKAAAAAGLALLFGGLLLGGAAAFAGASIEKRGRPRFLIPPRLRPEPGHARADLDISGLDAMDALGLTAADPDEFIVMAGLGSHKTSAGEDAGRLVLTSRSLVLLSCSPNVPGVARSWPVAEVQDVTAGASPTEFVVRLSAGYAETFMVEEFPRTWVGRFSYLLTLPVPVTSWYGDPAEVGQPVSVPEGMALVVLSRAEGGDRDKIIGYHVEINHIEVGKINRGERLELPIQAGSNTIDVRAAWVGSRPIRFDAAPGQVIRFHCEPAGFPGMTDEEMKEAVTTYIRLWQLVPVR
jgi:hypothetical protein